MIGPEQGLTLPGMTVVCGDSHTSTHGAFGAIAFGIGTSEVEHVLATQTLPQVRPGTMAVTVDGIPAREIAFPHPLDGTTTRITAPLPPHMEELWASMGFDAALGDGAGGKLEDWAFSGQFPA